MSSRTEADAPQSLPHVVRTVIEIAAPPAEVFEALTDPRELATWWSEDGGRTADCESDPRPGGAWNVRTIGPDGSEQSVGGEYRVVDPPHHLEQTWQAEGDAAPSIVRYDLEPIEIDGSDATRLTVTHTSPAAVARLAFESHTAATKSARFEPMWARGPHTIAWAVRAARRRAVR